MKQLTEAGSTGEIQPGTIQTLGNVGQQMFTNRVINMIICSVYWPLAPYFLSKQWKAKILVAVLLEEQVSFE